MGKWDKVGRFGKKGRKELCGEEERDMD